LNPPTNCQGCKRLVDYRKSVETRFPDYHCKPVNTFGETSSRLLIVGLAPGLHGANATGIPFTGDASGELLFHCLEKYGLADFEGHQVAPRFLDCRITNAVKCLPPLNKPIAAEINACNKFLNADISELASNTIILALGRIAHNAIIKALQKKQSDFRFGHHVEHALEDGKILIDSYHCSRYNIQTGRLTVEQFEQIFSKIRTLLDQ
jgi:uracil-DNA glycosylase family 4